MEPKTFVVGAVIAGSLSPSLPILQTILGVFGAPVGVFAGCLGGILLAVVRMEPGDKLSGWWSIALHYLAAVSLCGGALAYFETLKHIPSGPLGFGVAWALPSILPGLTRIVSGLPDRWASKFGPKPPDSNGGHT